MIRIKILGNKDVVIEKWRDDETVKDWLYRVLPQPTILEKPNIISCYYILNQGGNKNIYQNKDKLAKDIFDKDKLMYGTYYSLCPYNQNYTGNMMTTNQIRDDTCAICLENINLNDRSFAIECLHLFHYKCIKKLTDNNCPICREYSEKITFIRNY